MNQSLTVAAGLGIATTGSNPGPSSAGRIQPPPRPNCHSCDTGSSTGDQIMEIQRGAYPQFVTYAAGFTPHTLCSVGNHGVATTSSSFSPCSATSCAGRHVMQDLR